jgi:hypothetical protein
VRACRISLGSRLLHVRLLVHARALYLREYTHHPRNAARLIAHLAGPPSLSLAPPFPAAAFFFSLFLLEIVINSFVKVGYFTWYSFFFYLDLISAFSLIPDIPWIWNPILGLPVSYAFDNSNDPDIQVDHIQSASLNTARLLSILKFVKLIRLGRIAKLFELAQRTMDERAKARRRAARADDNTIHADDYTQSSQVGQTLSEQTTRKVVLLVLIMMLVIPLLQVSPFENAEVFMVQELSTLSNSVVTLGTVNAVLVNGVYHVVYPPTSTSLFFNGTQLAGFLANYSALLGQNGTYSVSASSKLNVTYIQSVVAPMYFPIALAALNASRNFMDEQFLWSLAYNNQNGAENLVYLRVRGTYYRNELYDPLMLSLRTSEVRASTFDSEVRVPPDDNMSSICVFNIQANAMLAANYSIGRTIATLVLLFLGAFAFDRNNKKMVIIPIERMVATIVQLQKNPLAKAVSEGEAEGEQGSGTNVTQSTRAAKAPKPRPTVTNETGMLERTLQKLTGLLQVGFGEAGSRMIKKCMDSNEQGDLDPLVDGDRIVAIFGFCDIRRFTDATECLREDVMMYVNEIATLSLSCGDYRVSEACKRGVG